MALSIASLKNCFNEISSSSVSSESLIIMLWVTDRCIMRVCIGSIPSCKPYSSMPGGVSFTTKWNDSSFNFSMILCSLVMSP